MRLRYRDRVYIGNYMDLVGIPLDGKERGDGLVGMKGNKDTTSFHFPVQQANDNLYSPYKHGRTINSTNQDTNTNQIKTRKQLQSGQKTLEAQFKFGHTFGP